MRRPRPSIAAFLLAGVSAGVAAVAFMAVPWPVDLVVAPAFAAWVVLLERLTRRDGAAGPAWSLLAVAGLVAVALVAALSALLAVVVP